MTWTWRAFCFELGWRHAFGDVSPQTDLVFAGGSSFGIEGDPIARSAALLEAGVDVELTDNATLGITYQGQIASNAREHGFNAKLSVRF
ncbi:autotransporter domain-containing protein [Pseudochrobactrum sp. AO18b]|uniref:autotransporter outer membrane beta-barrel domain-containing protein n=1 Tax=Pseudochrobactrum sp. AO18b TaxID=1201036 RepID=UPI0003B6A7A7|nr:autotransporter domain-containing protein [Pseudochrobactrum sp. AO18b]